jgi:hypothetical protein
MKTYLEFSNLGEVTELKTKDKVFIKENYSDFKYIINIIYNKYNFVLLYNEKSTENNIKNITSLPFYDNDLYGNFLLFYIDSNKYLSSFTEIKFLKLINVKTCNQDYSSDDFNLSD